MTLFQNKYRIETTRLQTWDYSSDGAYFITICTKNRKEYFGEIRNGVMGLNEMGCIANKFWVDMLNHFNDIELNEYVIMPNHIHGVIIIRNSAERIHESSLQNADIKRRRNMLIPKIIGRFKMQSAKQINIVNNKNGGAIWQENYYDHIIRNETELNRICEYIRNNPRKWEDDRNNGKNLWT
jgi:putative transposase